MVWIGGNKTRLYAIWNLIIKPYTSTKASKKKSDGITLLAFLNYFVDSKSGKPLTESYDYLLAHGMDGVIGSELERKIWTALRAFDK